MRKYPLLICLLLIYSKAFISDSMGREIVVSNENELYNAIGNLISDDTVIIINGTYNLTSTLVINNKSTKISNITIKGQSGNRDSVKLFCPGMGVSSTNAPHVFNIYNVENLTIQDLTAGETYWHPITISGQSGAENLYFKNLHLIDAGEQFIKVNNGENPKCDNGVVDSCLVEYTDYAFWNGDHYYTQGFDKIGGGDNWIVKNSVFKNIRPHPENVAQADGCGAAITYWQGGINSIVEKNIIINCRKGIEFGISDNTGVNGGVIRNNFIYRAASEMGGDNGIMVNDSPDIKVFNNTVILNATFDPQNDQKGKTIEYRFDGSVNLKIINNLSDGLIWERTPDLNPEISNHITDAELSWFVNAENADLHLKSTATDAIDHGLTLDGVVDDIDGEARPVSGNYDIGADEYSQTSINDNYTIKKVVLLKNHPNPFNSSTVIHYQLTTSRYINLKVYNANGGLVWETGGVEQEARKHSIIFSGSDLTSGIYYSALIINNVEKIIKKMVLIK